MVRPIRLITPISIHALRKESDRLVNILVISDTISIHALRKESDQQAKQSAGSLKYFNPRSP